jgi:hypothetical protein
VCNQLDMRLGGGVLSAFCCVNTGYEAERRCVISLIFCYTLGMRLDGCVLSASYSGTH